VGYFGAPCHGEFEFLLEVDVVREQQEPQGQPAYLAAKAKGENSMLVKRWRSENVNGRAAQDPDGMVKPRLAESQMPGCQSHRSDTTFKTPILPGSRLYNVTEIESCVISVLTREMLSGEAGVMFHAQGTKRDTYSRPRYVQFVRNTGSPKGRESYGDGAAIVVVGVTPHRGTRESRVQGKVQQVEECSLEIRYA
jgi:hypothetical protein